MNSRHLDAIRQFTGQLLPLTISGSCMAPALVDGQQVTFLNARYYLPGDIVVYLRDDQQMVAHRFLGYYRKQRQWRLLLQGDNNNGHDGKVLASQVLGRVQFPGTRFRDRIRSIWRYGIFIKQHFYNILNQPRTQDVNDGNQGLAKRGKTSRKTTQTRG